MKRSEAVLQLANILNSGLEGYEARFEFAKRDAETIMKKLETMGMKPPEAMFKAYNKGCLCTMHECCPSCGGICNKWEPENAD